jgi:myo-inositol catabolism protein IolS
MQYATLGNTDMKVSRITFGAMELGGGNAFAGGMHRWAVASDEENIKLLRTAYEKGINSFDTAELYGAGHSERVVGIALKDVRQDCIIATKISPHHLRPNDIRFAVSQSLFRLNTDYIDLYYIHMPSTEIPIADTMSELSKLKEEGIIRAIGVSNFTLEQLKEAMQWGRIDAIQPEYNLLERRIEEDLLSFCCEHSISMMSYNSIAKGVLTGRFHQGQEANDFRRDRPLFQPESLQKSKVLIDAMQEIADTKGATLAQIAIHWLFHQEGFTSAIVGTQNEQHLLDNVKASEITMTNEELEHLDSMSKQVLRSLTE